MRDTQTLRTLARLRREAEFKRRLTRCPSNDASGSPSESRALDHLGRVAAERERLYQTGRLDRRPTPLRPVRESHLVAEQQKESWLQRLMQMFRLRRLRRVS